MKNLHQIYDYEHRYYKLCVDSIKQTLKKTGTPEKIYSEKLKFKVATKNDNKVKFGSVKFSLPKFDLDKLEATKDLMPINRKDNTRSTSTSSNESQTTRSSKAQYKTSLFLPMLKTKTTTTFTQNKKKIKIIKSFANNYNSLKILSFINNFILI